MALRNLLVRVGADLSGLQKGMKQAQSQMQGFKSKVAGMLATIGAGLTLKDGIDDAIKYEAIMGTVSQTLGKSMGDFVKWQNTVGAAMGFTKLETAKMANEFSLRLKATAKDSQDLLTKTTDLMKAAAIIRSKTGMEMTEISDRMRSAMNQEADGADELGIDVRVAAVTMSKAYRDIAKNAPWETLSSEMKKTVLAQYIVEKTQQNFGWEIANNTALLKGSFLSALGDTRMALGQAFLPILNIALPLLTTLARKVEKVFITVAGFMRALFPKANIAAGTAQTDVIANQASATNDLGDAIDNTAKKKAKADKSMGVASFDEVNTLADPASATATDGGGTGGSAGGMGAALDPSQADDSITKISEKVKAFADKVRKIFAPVGEFLKKVWSAVSDYFVEKVKQMTEFWKENGSMIVQALQNVWNFCKPIISFIAKFIWDSIKGAIDGVIRFFEGLIKFLSGVFTGNWGKAWDGIKDMFFGAVQALWNFWNLTFVGGIKKALVEIVTNGAKFFSKFADDFVKLFSKGLSDVVTGVTNFIKSLRQFFTDFGNWMWNTGVNIAHNVSAAFESIGKVGTTIWNGIKSAFNGAVEWFVRTIITPVINRFEDIKNAFSKGIGNGFIAILNAAIDGFNSMLNGFNKIKNATPFKNKIPDLKIPHLAKGGITNGPTLAMIGDNPGGHEVVSPLDKLQDIVASAVGTAVMQAMQYSRPSGNGGDVLLNIDGRTFARIVKPFIDAEGQRVGGNVKLNPI
jgi:phage-related protein